MQRCGQLFKTWRVVGALPVTQETSCSRRSTLTRPEALGKHLCHFAKKSLKIEAFSFSSCVLNTSTVRASGLFWQALSSLSGLCMQTVLCLPSCRDEN